MFDGSVWAHTCTNQKPCDQGSYAVSSTPEPDRGFLGFLTTYFSAKKHVSIIFTAAREVSHSSPNESVIEVNHGEINLASALAGVPAGKWRVTLSDPSRQLDRGCSHSKPSNSCFTRDIEWPGEATLSVDSAALGIYALDVQSQDGEPLGSPAALLLVNSDSLARVGGEFERAKQLAARWQGIDAASIRAFLVQSLYAITMEEKQ